MQKAGRLVQNPWNCYLANCRMIFFLETFIIIYLRIMLEDFIMFLQELMFEQAKKISLTLTRK